MWCPYWSVACAMAARSDAAPQHVLIKSRMHLPTAWLLASTNIGDSGPHVPSSTPLRPNTNKKTLISRVQTNIEVLHKVAEVLVEKENIDGDEFQNIILASSTSQYLKEDAPGVTIPYQTA